MENIVRLKNDENPSILEYSQVESKKESHSLFWFLLSAFCGLIFVRNVLHIEYPIVILLVFFCVMAFCADHNEFMALAISCVPFSSAFQYRYALFALIVIYLAKFPRSIKHYNAYIPLALMMFWELLHGLLDFDFSFVSYLQSFAELIFLSFVLSLGNKKFDLALISRTLAICVAFAGGVCTLKLLADTGYNFVAVFSGGYRLGINDEVAISYALNYNANALGFMCNMSVCCLLVMGKINKLSFFDITLIAVLIFIGFLTLSRAFILCLLFVALAFLFVSFSSISKTIKSMVIIAISVIIIILAINYFAPYILENLLVRFEADDISSGRNELFVEYTEFVFSSVFNIIFGTGLQNVVGKVHSQGFIGIDNVSHNGIQELVVVWGIPGLIMFCGYVYSLIAICKRRIKLCFANYIPLFLLIFMVQSTQIISSGNRLLMLSVIYFVLSTPIKKSEGTL